MLSLSFVLNAITSNIAFHSDYNNNKDDLGVSLCIYLFLQEKKQRNEKNFTHLKTAVALTVRNRPSMSWNLHSACSDCPLHPCRTALGLLYVAFWNSRVQSQLPPNPRMEEKWKLNGTELCSYKHPFTLH